MYVTSSVYIQLGDLDFTWDSNKGVANLTKHGIAFEEAVTTWLDPFAIERFDEDHSSDQDRWLRIGTSMRGALLVIWSTERPARGRTVIRIIGARRANRKERKVYEQANEEDRSR